jgi:MoaA/NifB/PqqE/SkfB family radical SAM enzyme
MDLNKSLLQNLRRKSFFVDDVQMHDGVPVFSWIDVNLTELCNRKCVFCPRVDSASYPNQKLHMSMSLVEKMAVELRGLNYQGTIVLSGFGEPMLHPELADLVAVLGEDIRVEMVTNGDFLNAKRIKELVDAGLDYFVVSMYDGPHQKDLFNPMFAEAECNKEQFILRDRWYTEDEGYGLKLTNRAGTVSIGIQDEVDVAHPCYYPAYSMTIDWNGDALLCVQDWHKKVKAGNLYAQTMMEVWTSPMMQKRRTELGRGNRISAPCNLCNADGTLHGKNHVMAWEEIKVRKKAA